MTLSIIIPVYNVEQYIGPCLESVFRQGLSVSDFEVIIVNDGTRDRSFDVIAPMVTSHDNIVIVEQENQGLSVARNTGLSHAKGEYVLFLDSDDLLLEGTLPKLLSAAVANNADMVVADFVKMDDEAIKNNAVPVVESGDAKVMSGSEFFLGEFNPRECYVWRSLYSRMFLLDNDLRFIPGIYFEDVPFTTECHIKAERSVRIRLPFYVYRQRANSIVSSVNMRKLTDMNTVLARLWQMRADLCTTSELRLRMDDTIFATFSITVWYLVNDKDLLADRCTFIADLRRKVPELRFRGGMKQRVVSALFRLMPETYIRIRGAMR